MLDVRLLGEARVIAEDGRDVRVAHTRSIELLAYLIAHAGVPQQRRFLAFLLWPDSDESQARTNLRRELHNLRSVIGGDPSLDVQSATLTWRDHASCQVDVRTFELERAAASTGDAATRQSHAESAIAAYGGEFLPGVIDEWVLDTRSSLQQACADLCARTAADLRSTGDLRRALDVTRRRVRLMPLEEGAYRVLIEIQVELGDRAAAKATYRQLADVLRRQLDLAPDPATTALVDELMGSTGAAPTAPTPGTVSSVRGDRGASRLVGRAREFDALVQQWRLAQLGERTVVVVSGEPGVGKSRLVAELAALAASEDAIVATSRCFGQSGRLAFAPIADWLRSPNLARELATLEPVWKVEVERLLPSLGLVSVAKSPADVPERPPQPGADGWERLRFFEGLARAVLCARRPTLLVLDDLQWCDQETVAWLSFLLEFSRDAPLMVAATARRGALEDLLSVTTTVRSFRSSCVVHEMDLSPLDASDATALVSELTGRHLEAKEMQLLHAATGGYPLFIVEAARSQRAEKGYAATDVASVLRRRLEETTEPAHEVAQLAAAVGRDFSLDLLVEASDLDSVALVDSVEELTRCGILVERDAGIDFSHDLLRDVAYSSASAARRWLLHRRLAQGLELLHAGNVDVVAAQLADQYRRGGRPDRALPYHRRAADVAASLYANAESIRQHELSLELIRELPAGRARDEIELEVLLAISAPLNAVRGYTSPALLEVLERSASLAERLGRPDVLVRNLVGLFANRFVAGHTFEAHEFASRALALSVGDPDLVGQAHFTFGGSSTSLGMLESAVEHFDIAAEASTGGTPLVVGTRPEVHAVAWSAHAAWLLGNESEAAERTLDALARGRLVEQPYSLAVALAYAAVADQLRGDLEALSRDAAELRSLCRRHEFAYYAEWGLILEGWAAGGERGVRMVRLGIRSLRGQGALARMPYWLTLLADVLDRAGADTEARAVLDAALVVAEQHGERWWLPEVLRLRAAHEVESRAAKHLERARSIAASQSSAVLLRRCELDLARLGARRAGRPASASRTPGTYPSSNQQADRVRGAADRGA
jgi:DNA-binding SARP family transcriptional activator